MKISVVVREDAFRKPKSMKQIEEELREGATMLWVARGDVALEQAPRLVASVSESGPEGAEPTLHDLLMKGPDVGEDADFERPRDRRGWAPGSAKGFKELLLSMPDVGDDADFARPHDPGRPEVEWDT